MPQPLLREKEKQRRKKTRLRGRRLSRRDPFQVEHDILANLYHFGPSGRYRVVCFSMTSHPICWRTVDKLIKHGLVRKVHNIDESRSPAARPHKGVGYAVTQLGIRYKEKLAELLKLMGIDIPDFCGSE